MVHFPNSQRECQPLMRYLTLIPKWLLLHLKEPPGINSVPLYQLNKETHIDYYGHLTQPHHRTPNLIKDTDIHMDSVRVMAAEVNVPSDFFPAESYLIDNIINSIPRFATLERAPWDQ